MEAADFPSKSGNNVESKASEMMAAVRKSYDDSK